MHDRKFDENDETIWLSQCKKIAQGIRKRALSHTVIHGGYLSQACSSAEIFGYLYGFAMNLGPAAGPMVPVKFSGAPSSKNSNPISGMLYNGVRNSTNDRFFLSPTHYAMALYATLIECGRLGDKGLDEFNTDGSTVEMIGGEHSPGHETNGGSFGQTISQAAGVAWARKRKGDTGKVWIFLSDGECQEGQTWEALMAISFYSLKNIRIIVDANGQQVDGRCENVMQIDPLHEKFAAFGAEVRRVNGHDILAIYKAFNKSSAAEKPIVVIADTEPFRGIPLLEERYPNLHYIRFKNESERERYRSALKKMD